MMLGMDVRLPRSGACPQPARAGRMSEGFDGAHPRAWLLTILRNAQVNRTRRRRPELLDDPEAALDRLATEGSGAEEPETVVVGETFDAVVAGALAARPDRFRRAVRLVDVDGLSYAEAAQVLGVPVGTVMSRLHYARKKLQEKLKAFL